MKKIANCQRCTYYYITWEKQFPHGCRAMGFKSRFNPGVEVRMAMNGKNCKLFVGKSIQNTTPKKKSIQA
jgi:hypothetical protein